MAREEGRKELIQAWFYDQVTLPAAVAATTTSLFTIPRGQAGKTNTQTNLTGPGGYFTGVKSLTIKSMVLIPQSLIPSVDMDGVLNGWGELRIEDKSYPQPFNLKMVAGGAQLFESVLSAAVAPAQFVASVGDGRIDNVLSFTRPYLITIAADEVFQLTLNWDAPGFTPTVPVRLLFIMWGRYTRSVL